MTCNDIYDLALSLVSEPLNPAANDDYSQRAPYLLGAIIHQLAQLDILYREATLLERGVTFAGLSIDLTEEFPLCNRLASPAAYLLASTLVSFDNPSLSSTMYDRYCYEVGEIKRSIPFQIESIHSLYA